MAYGDANAISLELGERHILPIVKEVPDILILCHGGPISSPSDVEAILKMAPIHGFVGASSMERIPVEKGIREMTRRFASIRLPRSHPKKKS